MSIGASPSDKSPEGDDDDRRLDARFRTASEQLRLGAEAAGSISRIETTRVNLDGIKVFVPKVSTTIGDVH